MKLDSQNLLAYANRALKIFGRYAALWFALLLVVTFGFVAFQINNARDAQPSDDAVASQSKGVATPHIDPSVVDQIQRLQDHSVGVRTLFQQARDNPFSE